MQTTVLFFGLLAEVTGTERIELQNVKDTNALIEILTQQYPSLLNKKYRIAVNKKLISINQSLSTGDTIALLPPFAGG